MKQGWEIKKLGEVCEITMGQSPSSNTYNDSEGLPFYQGNGDFGKVNPIARVYCNAPIRIAECNDILISVRAPIGAINIANCKCCIGRGLASIRSTKSLSYEFVYHALIANKEKLIAQGTGSTFKSIGRSILKELPIPVPPLPIQERIVSELDLLNGIIEKKREQLKELDALAQSIFYDMFGDPITNEKGWEVKKLGEVCESVSYGTSNSSTENGEYKYLRMNNITYSGHIDITDIKYIDISDDEYEKYVVRKGDILFNRTNSKDLVGKTALFNFEEEMIIAGYIIRVRVNQDSIIPTFVVKWLNTPLMKSYFKNICKGAVNQSNINSKELKNIPISIPPLPLQHQFASKIEAIEKQKELIKQSISETETLFNERMQEHFG